MEAINRRVLEFLNHSGQSKSDFAKQLGVSPSVISHVSSGRNKVGLDLVQKMIASYPSLSANWLLSGAGTMFAEDNSEALHALELEIQSLKADFDKVVGEINVVKRRFDALNGRLT